MLDLRRAAGLEVSTMAPPTTGKVDYKHGSGVTETAQPPPVKAHHHSSSTPATQSAADGAESVVKGEDEANSAAGSSHDGKRPENIHHGDDNHSGVNQGGGEQLLDQARIDSGNDGAEETPKSTAAAGVKDQPSVGASNAFSSLATGMLRPKIDGGRKARVGKVAAVISSGAGRERREEARRREELYEVCVMK